MTTFTAALLRPHDDEPETIDEDVCPACCGTGWMTDFHTTPATDAICRSCLNPDDLRQP